jgi:hypothetical protein
MKIKLLSIGIIGFGILSAALISGLAIAQTVDGAGITYPVAELGNCADKDACKKYCDDSAHLSACLAFAEKNNLMPKEELDTARKFLASGGKGPGGCTGQRSCEAYCDDISHMNECVAYAEKNGILSPAELAEAKQVQAAIAKGATPPPCRNKKECDAYCDDPANMKVCVAFGEAAGFLKGKELEDAKKMMAAVEKGVTPPPCRGKESCDAYCSEPEHMEACITFAQAAGFMSPEEAENSGKMLQALKKGVRPLPCRGKEECDAYCSADDHMTECINFSVAAGFMSEKDAEMARKTGGKGPGGCKSKEECEAFCKDPSNQATCMNFAKEHGLISAEELKKMEEGQQQFRQSVQNMPQAVADCLSASVGPDMFEKIKSGQIMPSEDIGQKMGQCFGQFGGPGQGQGPAGAPNIPSPGQGGGEMMPPASGFSPEVMECIRSAVGQDVFEGLRSGSLRMEGNLELMMKARNCLGDSVPQGVPPQGMMPGNIPGGAPSSQGFAPSMPAQGGAPICPEGQPCGPGPGIPGQFPGMPGGGEPGQMPPGQFNPPVGPQTPEGGQMMPPPQYAPGTGPGTGGEIPGTPQMQPNPQDPSQTSPPPPPPTSGFTPVSFLGYILGTFGSLLGI